MLSNMRLALQLVWRTSRLLSVTLLIITILAGILPAAVAYVAALIVDAVVEGLQSPDARQAIITHVLSLVALEGLLVAALAAAHRTTTICQSLLRGKLSQCVNELIFDKALTLELQQLENANFYDKVSQVHRGASSRPLSVVMRTAALVQNGISLVSFGTLLFQFSPWAVLLLLLAGVPLFMSEAKFSGDAFRIFLARSPDARMQAYLSTMLVREDHAKEIRLFGLGRVFVERHRRIHHKLYREERALTLRRGAWAVALGLIATSALYGAYGWISVSAILAQITLGQMTMYLALFRQGQATVSSMLTSANGIYEDQLYLTNLQQFLRAPDHQHRNKRLRGSVPNDGIRFEHVSFTYPDQATPALHDINLHIRANESLGLVGPNGSGKTTLIKLLSGLYAPSAGRILLDGLDLQHWDEEALRARMGILFQDFRRYQFSLGENIGAGDAARIDDELCWHAAAEKAQLGPVLERLTQGYRSQLGTWFSGGTELSGGQWQKVALSRAFMRSQADILILDEPTAAMDAAAEAAVIEGLRTLAKGRIMMIISHRLSNVRHADRIVVLKHGRIVECGSHDDLMQTQTQYRELFRMQATRYS